MKKIYYAILTLILSVLLVGCAKTVDTSVFRFEARSLALTINDSQTVGIVFGNVDEKKAVVYEAYGYNNETNEYDIKNTDIISIVGTSTVDGLQSTSGKEQKLIINATNVGKAKLFAYYASDKSINDNIIVEVKNYEYKGILLDCPSVVFVGQTLPFAVKNSPKSYTNEFTIENLTPEIMSVTDDFNIKGLVSGNGKLKVTSTYDKNYSITKNITVGYDVCKSISLPKSSIQMELATTYQITPTVKPEFSNPLCEYKTSNQAVCTVDEKGVVTAVGIGTAKITVTNSKIPAYLDVEVIYATPTGIDAVETMTVDKEYTAVPEVSILPVETTKQDYDITILEGDNIIATEVVNGKKGIKGLEIGTAKIEVATLDGNYSKVINVTCKYANPTSITVKNTAFVVGINNSIGAEIVPSKALQEMTYTVENPAILTIAADGTVTPIATGTTKVTVTAVHDTSIIKEVEVTVYAVPTNITLLEAGDGDTYTPIDETKPYIITNDLGSKFENVSVALKIGATPEAWDDQIATVTVSDSNIGAASIKDGVLTVTAYMNRDFTVTITVGTYSKTFNFRGVMTIDSSDSVSFSQTSIKHKGDVILSNESLFDLDGDEYLCNGIDGDCSFTYTDENDNVITIYYSIVTPVTE